MNIGDPAAYLAGTPFRGNDTVEGKNEELQAFLFAAHTYQARHGGRISSMLFCRFPRVLH
jgi:hypothetical protein